jgi:LysM repeat protein
VTAETSCPVCAFGHIPAAAGRCPQCDADLECFRIIDSLPDDLAADDRSNRSKRRGRERPLLLHGLTSATIGLLVIGFSFLLYSFEQLESRLEKQQARLAEVETGHRVRKAPLSPEPPNRDTAAARPSPVVPKASPAGDQAGRPSAPTLPVSFEPSADGISDGDETAFFVYRLRQGDTLWSLARRFYRDGDLYPVLLLHNPKLEIYRTTPGSRLKVLKDKKNARSVFEQIAETDPNGIYWRYTVRQEDTLQSLATRFYGPGASVARITGLNPGVEITAGNSIRIALE